ncbi:MAG: hypothetical protein GQ574_22195 [Crocinitomix sp.]|nr:hypothetical protein [Crocinitomix sp.]
MKISIVIILLFTGVCHAQDSTLNIELDRSDLKKMEFAGVFKSSISLEGGGKSGYGGISYDLLLSRKWRVGIGGGYSGAGADVKFYPWGVKRDKLVLNLGLRANAFLPLNGTNYMFYSAPIGLSFFTLNRINLELDAGPLLKRQFDQSETEIGFGSKINYAWVSIKVGYRFSFYAMKRSRKLDRLE